MPFGSKVSPIGVDLGGTVKLVQFRTKGDTSPPELHATGRVEAGVPVDAAGPAEPDEFVSALKKALSAGKFGSRRAVVALPASEVDFRPLTLPVDEHDIGKKVRWEAESYLAGSADDHLIDHVVLGEARTAGERRLEVLAVSADKQRVLPLLDLLGRAGLTVDVIDIVPLALCRFLGATRNGSDEPIAAIDIGAQSTSAVIMGGDDLRMARPIDIGGNTFTEAIQTALEINIDEAEVLKCQHGAGAPRNTSPDAGGPPAADDGSKIVSIVHDILREKLDLLASELHKLFRYFAAQNQGRTVEKVFLVGGGGALKRLDALLTERLGTPVEAGKPLTQITGHEPELKRGHEGAFAVAAGLALRSA